MNDLTVVGPFWTIPAALRCHVWQVEVLEVVNDFAKVRSCVEADGSADGTAAGTAAVEGWVRSRNIQRAKRESGLASMKSTLSREFSRRTSFRATRQTSATSGLAEGTSSPTPAASAEETKDGGVDEGAAGGGTSSTADEATEVEIEIPAKELATELASWLKIALEKANMRAIELFRDWDSGAKGHVERAEFVRGVHQLGVQHSEVDIGRIFDTWDADGSGTLDYRELERAVKGGAKGAPSRFKSSISAKEIQKSLSERLKGRVEKKTGAGAAAAADRRGGRGGKGGGAKGGAVAEVPAPVGEYVETGDEPEGTWAASKWLNSLNISRVITKALHIPSAQVCPMQMPHAPCPMHHAPSPG